MQLDDHWAVFTRPGGPAGHISWRRYKSQDEAVIAAMDMCDIDWMSIYDELVGIATRSEELMDALSWDRDAMISWICRSSSHPPTSPRHSPGAFEALDHILGRLRSDHHCTISTIGLNA